MATLASGPLESLTYRIPLLDILVRSANRRLVAILGIASTYMVVIGLAIAHTTIVMRPEGSMSRLMLRFLVGELFELLEFSAGVQPR